MDHIHSPVSAHILQRFVRELWSCLKQKRRARNAGEVFCNMASTQIAEDNGGKRPMWVYPETTGADAPERWGHSACFCEGKLYIFGGCCGGLHFRELLTLDLKTMAWSSLASTGHQPETRDSHSAVLMGQRMIIFGGTNGSKKFNDVYILDLSAQSWSHPSVKGDPPAPRESHSATLVGDKRIVIFGGSGEGDGNHLNDLHILHLDNMEWTSPQVKGKLPTCRDSHTAVAIGNQLFVYGGDCRDRYLGELDILDLQTLTWIKLEMADGIQPGVRAGHAAVTLDNKMYIFGGVGDRAYYNDVWMLDVDSRVWTLLDVVGPNPQGRFSHVAVLAGNDIAVYGGCGEDEQPLNEFMVLCLKADQLSEGSPLRRYVKNKHGLVDTRGKDGLKDVVEGSRHERGACGSEGKNDECNLRLIDPIGGNTGCRWKEEFLNTAKRNCLDMKAESRISRCPLSIPSINEADSLHKPGLSTILNTSASKSDSHSELQQRMRLRKVPWPYIENMVAHASENNHTNLKRRKTSHLVRKLEGVDSEPDDHSPPISDHSSPSQTDPEQIRQKLHAMATNSKPLQPHFTMLLPQQPPGTLACSKYQARRYSQKFRQHKQHSHLGPQLFSIERQRMLRIPTLQLHALQKVSLPVYEAQSAHLKPVAVEHCAQDSTVRTLLQQRQAASSITGDEHQKQTNCRLKCLPNLVGSEVRGCVDGAFDSGYLMTAQLNGQVFRGLLFPHSSSSGIAVVNVPASNHDHVRPTVLAAHQPSVVIPSTVAQQGSSNLTPIGYPVFPVVHLTNSTLTAGANCVCFTANSGAETCTTNKLPNTTSISCSSVTTALKEIQRATESDVHNNIRKNGTLQVSVVGGTRANDDVHGETYHVHTGSTQANMEMVGNVSCVVRGQARSWVWQPPPGTYHPTMGHVGDNIQFVAASSSPGVAHTVNEVQTYVPTRAALWVGQNSGGDSVADIQAAVTLAAPTLSTPAASNPTS
ncbi:hypothetical protein O6H91_11G036400 [Diphasiastrum complanatum]|uniref:Uncharacterized protein n=2 Tax=Diphasiastrum complanatum TaxID=34168 RepID=A0ACC2C843_DIPCM|nr:hypothetical protein O6H91_11G036400 [Diphasiastrum complanatum]KAJ7538158.1 hypothetical protein O6H91_11G036400 [Diphasiastrum complanatum]